VNGRLTALERTQQRVIGGLLVLGALVGGGAIEYIGRALKLW
jgi:hypothetical protein